MKRSSRHPLKAKPLRVAGESVQAELDELAWSTAGGYYLLAALCILLTLLEWVAAWTHSPRVPMFYTLLTVLIVPFCAFRITAAVQKSKRLKLGRDGERAVGQFLEGMRTVGARVFHDIPAEGFNLDHVVLCPRGIFVVETKTRTKPRKAQARIALSERGVALAGGLFNASCLEQAQAAARWLRSLLHESTGRDFAVRSAVVFPGWFVEPMSAAWKRNRALPWVLEPKALPTFIENESLCLSMEDVALAAYHLSRYVRAEQERAAR